MYVGTTETPWAPDKLPPTLRNALPIPKSPIQQLLKTNRPMLQSEKRMRSVDRTQTVSPEELRSRYLQIDPFGEREKVSRQQQQQQQQSNPHPVTSVTKTTALESSQSTEATYLEDLIDFS